MPIDKNADTPDRIRRNFQRLAHSHSYGEVPTGAINGSNTIYTVLYKPTTDLAVFQNGLRLASTAYTVVGKTITMASAPTGGDILLIDYIY